MPPVIGWASVTGSLSFEPLLLFSIIFMWTPPHFWALALVKNDDYTQANIPMLPVVADYTRRPDGKLLFTPSALLSCSAHHL